MKDRLYLKPKPGMVLRDPHTRQALPADGAWVPDNSFWQRRITDGDAVGVTHPEPGPSGLEPVTPLTTREGGERNGSDR